MDHIEAMLLHGSIVFQDKHHVVRLQRTKNEIIVRIHKVKDGNEQIPLAYMIGVNYMSQKGGD